MTRHARARLAATCLTLILAIQSATARSEGRYLELSGESLGDVVASINRESAVQLVIGDAELARIPLAGRLRWPDAERFAAILQFIGFCVTRCVDPDGTVTFVIHKGADDEVPEGA